MLSCIFGVLRYLHDLAKFRWRIIRNAYLAFMVIEYKKNDL